MKRNGFTLIEVMIVVAIIAILGTIVYPVVFGNSSTGINDTNRITYGIGGSAEVRCIEGYKFVITYKGQLEQIMDNHGNGVQCL